MGCWTCEVHQWGDNRASELLRFPTDCMMMVRFTWWGEHDDVNANIINLWISDPGFGSCRTRNLIQQDNMPLVDGLDFVESPPNSFTMYLQNPSRHPAAKPTLISEGLLMMIHDVNAMNIQHVLIWYSDRIRYSLCIFYGFQLDTTNARTAEARMDQCEGSRPVWLSDNDRYVKWYC